MVLVAVLGGSAEQLMRAEESSLPLFPEAVSLAPDVQHVAAMQQPVQHRRGDDGVAEKLAPFAEDPVGRQDDDASLVAGKDQVAKVVAASRP